VPANATIVVAGRVKFKEVVSLVEKWFGDIPSGRKPQRNLPQEPSQKDHRKEIVETDVPANSIMLGIPMVERTHPAYHAIDLLSDLLGRGDSSFLNQRLVEQAKLFSSISAYVMGSLDPGLMMIQGYVSDGISPEEAENALLENLAEFSKLNVEERNLEKVKNQAESSLAFGEVELLNKAMNIAFSSNMGNTNWVNQESEKIQAVTVEDIQDWSNKLINQVGRNTLVYKKLG
jgi:zinc protease